jgi:hypothetical protein
MEINTVPAFEFQSKGFISGIFSLGCLLDDNEVDLLVKKCNKNSLQ